MAKTKVRPKAKRNILREVAAECAALLFSDHRGGQPRRLVLEMPNERLGGAGWSQSAVEQQILIKLKKRLEVID